jgi:hypothetical protein
MKRESFFTPPRIILLMVLAWMALVASTAHAGQTCEEKPPSAEALRSGLELAARTRDTLAASNAEVALIARAGQDLRKHGLKYSHLGFIVRDHADGAWTVVHMLNHCGKPDSGLFAEGLGMFFMDQPFRYEALVMVPAPEVQAKLKALLASDAPLRFKAARYNMLAYPFNAASQNSNQWALELLAVAMSREREVRTREDAHAYLKFVGFEPSTIHLDALTRLGAAMTRQNIDFNDHPFNRRMAGKIDTVTVDSLEKFLLKRDAVTLRLELRL